MRKLLPLIAVSMIALPLAACGEAGSGDDADAVVEEAEPAMEEAADAVEDMAEDAVDDAAADERGNTVDRSDANIGDR